MTAETAYTNIRTGVANYIIANVDWVTALETDIFDYTPDDIAIVFGHLPSIVVDFDPRTVNEWTDMGQGALEGVPVMIQVFTEIEPDDTTHGRDASQDVADKLSELENLFRSSPSVGGLVKGSSIGTSKIELLELAAVKLAGVTARWAWFTLIVVIAR